MIFGILLILTSFIDISWGDEHYHTKVIQNNLNPKWEGDDKASWTIDVIEETRLQDEPLVFKVVDGFLFTTIGNGP